MLNKFSAPLISVLGTTANVSATTIAFPPEIVTAEFFGPAFPPSFSAFEPFSGIGIIENTRVAQTFETTISGYVETVDLLIEMRFSNATTNPFVVGIYSTENGLPAQLLGQSAIPAGEVPVTASTEGFSVRAQFPLGNVFLQKGETYAILSDSQFYTFFGRGDLALFNQEPAPAYSGGRLMRDDGPGWWTPGSDDKDAYFRVGVSKIPEPSLPSVFSIGIILSVCVRRRQS